jgi:hypothetical protein
MVPAALAAGACTMDGSRKAVASTSVAAATRTMGFRGVTRN